MTLHALFERGLRATAAIALIALAITQPVAAQTFPDRPLKLIVPQPPGGGFDTVARILAERMGPKLGQAIVVENKPGAGTLVGTDAAAKSTADGYTLLLGALSNIALNPGLYPKLPYDPQKDFAPIGLAVSWPYMLVARKDLPHADLRAVIAFAKSNPGTITYASGGRGSGQHIALALVEKHAGVQLTHVAYRGAQAAYQDLLGGRIDLFFDIASTAKAQVDAGTLKALAVSSKTRQSFYPDVPSVEDTGAAPLDMESWFGLFVPAAAPAPVRAKLRDVFEAVMADPEVAALFAKTGGRTLRLSLAETEALVASEIRRWTALLKDAGITAEQ